MFDRCLYSSDYKRLIGVFPFVKVTTLHDSLEEIGEFSFYKSSIKSVIIPSSVKRIKRYAFFKSNIENVAFPEDSMLEIIEEYSFSYCLELFELNLSLLQNLEAIQPYAFYATLLRKFAFPENDVFTEINPSFQGFVSIEIPSQIQFIYDNAFPVGYSSSSSSYYYSVLSEVKFKGNSELIYIGKYSFTSFISEIEIPNSTLKIDDYAFCNCPCLQYVIIPEDSSLTYIGYQAFGGCNLKEIFIPKYLNNISFGAFGFKHTLNIKISPLNKYFYADDNYLYSNRNQTIIQCLKIEMNSTIPLYVKELGSELFKNSILEEIFIPKNITVIHNSTFQYSSLKIVKFEEGSQLQEIPSMTFAYTKISNFFVPKFVSKIGDRAFYYSSIENISFENGSQLLEISDSAFEYCKITNILLPSALNYIGNNAFYQCNTLSNINFCERSQLRVIGNNSFAYNNISSILIPSSVQVINDSAFYQCNFWLVLHLRIIAT
ncbi:surface antigen Bsp, putative [Trichomonas vaginalis G3]|uniref:Surface antigen Bsp, putative n=1 Tax=Trichomonas vaginalis (strain ATCC PRA-98 / G3) TaxID=412133 RepID=A2FZD0_TRIV3|nr:leucine-rich repeats (6 copies)-containing protein [Trichomonas vaginalis G3]EAX89736.1 surface antigen Bsp, putative [Trichomonas vaginalis G3]KAI5496111.1 leucine-rich repeats (6 copies)-containing protein [Trichomonas vaginalis G3]|eukprot:XP_001302666.1 surface antigen Bsp [Trichomonas vaginalis G3]